MTIIAMKPVLISAGSKLWNALLPSHCTGKVMARLSAAATNRKTTASVAVVRCRAI